jgi:hypothetical protein
MKFDRLFEQHAKGTQGQGREVGFILTLLNSKIIHIRNGWFVTWIELKFHIKLLKAVSTVWG